MLEGVTSDVQVEPALQPLPVKKSKEISLTKLDLRLAPEDFGLEDREHSSTLGYLIPTLNVIKQKPCENAMKLTNKKKKRKYSLRILVVEQETFTPLVLSNTTFEQLEEWEENVRCLLKNLVNLSL